MAGNVFINYRRDDSSGVAGRLHDRMAQAFGSHNIFMDVDNIPVGVDFEGHLKSQVAACDAMVAVIGPNWLDARDETGRRRLDNPEDFVTIEIAAAIARNIPVIPVLLDGARMPKASQLPDSLKLLARRQAFGVRHAHFGQDAESLIAKMKVALGQGNANLGWWRLGRRDLQIAAVIVVVGALSWFGWNVLSWYQEAHAPLATPRNPTEDVPKTPTNHPPPNKIAAPEKTAVALNEAVPTKSLENQPVAAADAKRKADQERQTKAAAEAEAKRKVDEPPSALKQGDAAIKSSDFDRAIANFNEAIQLDPENANAFGGRGLAYLGKGDLEQAIADFNRAIRFNPSNASAFNNRGVAYLRKRDYDLAIVDFSEAIRLNPNYANAFCNRALAKQRSNDNSGSEDKLKAQQLDALACR